MDSPRPQVATNLTHWQETELFIINSSPGLKVGPNSRVIRRKDNCYMLPRSPPSPTLSKKGLAAQISGSWSARLKSDYVMTNEVTFIVSELEVERFQLLSPFQGKGYFPLEGIINTQRAPVFNPYNGRTTSFSQLHALDMLPARGIPEIEFWRLFSKCGSCGNFMTARTTPYHACPAPLRPTELEGNAYHDADASCVADLKKQYFLRFLDVHGVGRAAGVPEGIFRAFFYSCAQCGYYMTDRISQNHHEDADLGDYTCVNRAAAWQESKFGLAIRRALSRKGIYEEFPALEPL